MKISLPNFFYDLQAPQISIYSKIDTGGVIPFSVANKRFSPLPPPPPPPPPPPVVQERCILLLPRSTKNGEN